MKAMQQMLYFNMDLNKPTGFIQGIPVRVNDAVGKAFSAKEAKEFLLLAPVDIALFHVLQGRLPKQIKNVSHQSIRSPVVFIVAFPCAAVNILLFLSVFDSKWWVFTPAPDIPAARRERQIRGAPAPA